MNTRPIANAPPPAPPHMPRHGSPTGSPLDMVIALAVVVALAVAVFLLMWTPAYAAKLRVCSRKTRAGRFWINPRRNF